MLKKLSQRALVVLCALLFLGSTIGILILYRQLSRVSERDVVYTFRQAIEQAAITLNDRMAFSEETMSTLLYDSRFQESLNREQTDETLANQLEEIKYLRELVYNTETSRNIHRIRLYLNSEKMITREDVNFFSLSQAKKTYEYAHLLTANGRPVWIGEHPIETRYFSDSCVTLGRFYRSYFSPLGRKWALVMLDISLDQFTQILDTLELPDTSGHVVLVDQEGRIMAGSGNSSIVASIVAHVNENEDTASFGFYAAPDAPECAYVVYPLELGGWSILMYTPRATLLNSQHTLRSTLTLLLFGLTLLLIALIALFVLAFYARNVRHYINRLNQGLRSSDAPKKNAAPAYGALLRLDQSIDELLATNKQLAEENYHSQLREREVTLQALQAQINPHFLYNTLDSINWMAIRDGAENVSDAITTLADYFRISLSRGLSTVTLTEDANIVRKYLTLYRHRYDFSYDIRWQLSEESLSCLLPKLTLQPLVENALQHGIFKRREKQGGIVTIAAEVRDGFLVLTVQDNGPGLPADAKPEKGYGMRNVRERLELYFFGQYEMNIRNAPAGGAIVTIKITAKHGEANL